MIPAWVGRDLESLDRAAARRRLRVLETPCAPRIRVQGREVINFSSNDYLGLAADRRLAEAAAAAARRWGAGAGASRLITGTLGIHEQLEQALARCKGTETALLFNSGYQANLGLLQALGAEGVIFSDARNHASIVDGCRLARARIAVYRHADASHLAELLENHADAPRKLVVTDGVFSMDGDLAPLPEIVELAGRHGALVVVDDAHATGVIGRGRGSAHHFALAAPGLIQVGTLGKALGSFGAFVAGPALIRELLVNRARSLIYTTGPPPAAAGAALEALRILEAEPQLLARLQARTRQLRSRLQKLGFATDGGLAAPTPIVPVILGSNRRTLEWAAHLWDQGLWVHPIRPPTVAEGSSRLRITVSAAHTTEEVERLCEALEWLRTTDC